MRVLFVCTTGGSGRRQMGGAERILTEIIPAHARNGVDVIAATPDDEVARALRSAGVPWIELGARSRIDLSYAREIRHTVRRLKPDVVCAHLLSAAMHTRAGLAVDRTPLVVTLHNSLWQYRAAAASARARAMTQSNIALDLTMRRLRPHASVAVSEFEATELRVRGRAKNVHLIPNPLPANWPVPEPAQVPPGGAPRIGFLGRLEREKGADLLGEIAAQLPEMRFTVAGAGSVAVAPQPNLELLGHVEPAGFLRRLDCLVVPSRVESFGLSALEALSLGVPVVHSGAGGLAEVTRAADGVLAFRADLTPAALAGAVRRAVGAMPPERRLALAGWYTEEFAFHQCVQRWHDLYRMVAS